MRAARGFGVLVYVLSLITVGCDIGTNKGYRIGILIGVDAYAVVADGFISEMMKLGYVDGDNTTYDIRNAHSNVDKMKEISQSFVADRVDLILAITTGTALIAKQAAAGSGIPVVFSVAVARDGELIRTIREPGDNITGVRYPSPDMGIKRFEFLLELKPETKRILVAYQKDYPAAMGLLEGLRPVVLSRGVTLVDVPVKNLEELRVDFESRVRNGIDVDAIQIMPEPFAHSDEGWAIIKAFAKRNRLPVAGIVPSMARDGAILSFNPDSLRMGEMAAPLARKILTGTPAGTIPVVSPELYLRINYKVCRDLGLTVPKSLLKISAEIIR